MVIGLLSAVWIADSISREQVKFKRFGEQLGKSLQLLPLEMVTPAIPN
jgi:hypothetical protein